jgi:hypothetical protein
MLVSQRTEIDVQLSRCGLFQQRVHRGQPRLDLKPKIT